MNILDLITADGFRFQRVGSTHGGEYAGPCPFCGGNDRFRIWPNQKGGRFWCRGCEKTGDSIQYLRDLRGLSFAEACQALGISKVGYRRKKARTLPEKQIFKAKNHDLPTPRWMQKANAILKNSQSALWTPEGQAARDLLFNKGLLEETILHAGIGCNPADLYRDQRGWGMPQEVRHDGKPKLLWIPAGLVIPLQCHEGPGRLRIRRHDPGDGPRYVIVAGSTLAPLIIDQGKKVLLVVESELDAWLCWQEAGDLTSVMAMGAAGMKPDVSAHELLLQADIILNGLDYDAAGAMYSWKWWCVTYGQKVIRWPVPIGKDPSDAWAKGLNIRDWIETGIE